MSYLLRTILYLALILITESYLEDLSAYEIKKVEDNITSIAQSMPPISFKDIQKSSVDPQNPFFWHLVWLGTVLSICGLIGLSALIPKFQPIIKKILKLSYSKTNSGRIPAPW